MHQNVFLQWNESFYQCRKSLQWCVCHQWPSATFVICCIFLLHEMVACSSIVWTQAHNLKHWDKFIFELAQMKSDRVDQSATKLLNLSHHTDTSKRHPMQCRIDSKRSHFCCDLCQQCSSEGPETAWVPVQPCHATLKVRRVKTEVNWDAPFCSLHCVDKSVAVWLSKHCTTGQSNLNSWSFLRPPCDAASQHCFCLRSHAEAQTDQIHWSLSVGLIQWILEKTLLKANTKSQWIQHVWSKINRLEVCSFVWNSSKVKETLKLQFLATLSWLLPQSCVCSNTIFLSSHWSTSWTFWQVSFLPLDHQKFSLIFAAQFAATFESSTALFGHFGNPSAWEEVHCFFGLDEMTWKLDKQAKLTTFICWW